MTLRADTERDLPGLYSNWAGADSTANSVDPSSALDLSTTDFFLVHFIFTSPIHIVRIRAHMSILQQKQPEALGLVWGRWRNNYGGIPS